MPIRSLHTSIKRLLQAFVSIALFLFLAETLLWIAGVDPHPKGIDFTVNRALDYPEAFLKDHDLFWRLRPNRTIISKFFEGRSYAINRQGFRGDNFTIEKSGLRVAVLGNSCSFGWGVEDRQSFAGRLQDRLRSRPDEKNVDVYNFSVPGYSSFQGKRNYRKYVRPYRPDILVVTFAWNDQWLSADNRPDKAQKMPPQLIIDFQNIVSRLRFYRVLKGAVFSFASSPDTLIFSPDYARVSLEDFKGNLGDIITMARKDNVRVILLTSPCPSKKAFESSRHPAVIHTIHGYYNDMIRETAAVYSVELIDIAALFTRDDFFDDLHNDPFHYNANGHALIADTLSRLLASPYPN